MKIAIIGGGAAGMMVAISASIHNPAAEVLLLEKNKTLGKKLAITGGGRCNITNICSTEELIEKVIQNPRFLYGALNAFTSQDLLDMLHKAGLKTKVEESGRIFPTSDNSQDVIDVFERYLLEGKVKIFTDHIVDNVEKIEGKFMITTKGKQIEVDKLIIATGGLSAPATGSTGDGYTFAKALGHSITPELKPAIVPLKTKENWPKQLQGVSISNIGVTLKAGDKTAFKGEGDIIFTHFGVSGPVVLRASSYLSKNATLILDLLPQKNEKELEAYLLAYFKANPNKAIKTCLESLLVKKMAHTILEICNIHEDTKINNITKEARASLVQAFKALPLTITGTHGFATAVATAGGIPTKEINPKTMESKITKNLYLAGEVIDIHAHTGGYNLQIAFSMGYVAGKCAALVE